MGIHKRVRIIQTGQKTNGDPVIPHPINKTSAEGVGFQGIAHGFDHISRLDSIVRQFPDFFDAHLIALTVLALIQFKFLNERFSQIASGAVSKDSDLGL